MHRSRFLQKKGAALVVVLSLLVMLTVLVTAFFLAVETDTQSATSNHNMGGLRQLSELPLQIIKTQIQAATTLGQTGTLEESVNTWTSQPGLLRVFRNTGDLVRAYKLYSSSTMDSDTVSFIGNEIPGNWIETPNRWVNLNEPILSVTKSDQKNWPILNPRAVDWAEGLEIANDPAGQGDATMPVEWLYVLEDGSVVSYDQITDAVPPIGRIAFWTDDETCKLNINTAGERTMWDRPRFAHGRRIQFARNQPSTGEYNAYPGHPSTVSLSAVFGKSLKNESGINDTEDSIVEAMLKLTPRYQWGGSANGKLSIWAARKELDRTKNPTSLKNGRLYATPSELLLTASRDIQDERLRLPIQESGFLLTESSRAPEINSFGLPRVSIWPIDSDPEKRTVYDKLIAHATTIGSKPYYFQRGSPAQRDEAESIPRNWDLLVYLDRLTQKVSSGFSNSMTTQASFQDKWGSSERRQILTSIFDYIRTINLSDTSRQPSDYKKQFTPANQEHRGTVLPTKINALGWNTRGAGRVPILDRIGLVFYAVKQTMDGNNKPESTEMRCMVWLNFFSPMYGLAPHAMNIRVRLTNFKAAVSNSGAGEFHDFILTGNQRDFTFPNTESTYDWGGPEDMIGKYRSNALYFAGSGKSITYEFISSNLVKIQGSLMDFQGGTWKLEIFDQRQLNEPLQTYSIEFPNSTTSWPVPTLYGGRNNVELPERYNTGQGSLGQDMVIGRRRLDEDPCDVIRGIELRDGDLRQIAHLEEVPASFFQPAYGYFSSEIMLGGTLRYGRQTVMLDSAQGVASKANSYAGYGRHVDVDLPTTSLGRNFRTPSLPHAVDSQQLNSLRSVNWIGDFDNGFFKEADGAYLNKADEGHLVPEPNGILQPYETAEVFATWSDGTKSRWDPSINGFFSPTRQAPSPVMFGSLPTGVRRTLQAYISNNPADARPWETLLFCPNSLAATVADGTGATGHPGAKSPQDHLLLDLFTMPVVEPYAITEPFSTAGKINMNQRIIPFAHIKRETGFWGVLKNLELSAAPAAPSDSSAPISVNIPATLRQISDVLDPEGNQGLGVFRSASEICDIFLIPSNLGSQTLQQYWRAHQRTGNNSREMPYNYIYPMLTTKSNTYQIHYRVQTLKPLKQKANYSPGIDFTVEGEQRGSYVIERYLDVHDPRFSGSSPEVNTDTTPLNEFYQFRTLRHNRFTPGS